MKIIGAVVLTSLVLLPVLWQPGMTASNDPKPERVADASGNLRVLSHRLSVFGQLGGRSRPRPGCQGDFDEETSPFGAKGLRELTAVTVASAIGDIVYRATRRRVRHLPTTMEKLL